MERDLRLYYYESGQLIKEGRGSNQDRPHLFTDINLLKEHVDFLRNNYKSCFKKQFVVVEYFDKYKSKIIEVI